MPETLLQTPAPTPLTSLTEDEILFRDNIRQFAEEILRITGSQSKIETRPLPVDDPKVRQPNITRARKLLGWEPKVPFEEGIATTIEYFRTRV